jgi:hypothetical protein
MLADRWEAGLLLLLVVGVVVGVAWESARGVLMAAQAL